jgi:uncharacterized damage-inducible protein DinB
MKTPTLSLICVACISACILGAGAVGQAQTSAANPDQASAQTSAPTSAPAADTTAPSYDLKAQALLDLKAVNKKCVDLAQSLPADKLTWRPTADTRSFAEVFLHVAGERYGFLSLLGATPPAGFKAGQFDKSTIERDRIVEALNQSWEFTSKTINGMTNADFAKLQPKLGPQANEGDVVYLLVADAHEHLGQLVAYSRQNGIVPPWTVERQKKKAAAAAAGK